MSLLVKGNQFNAEVQVYHVNEDVVAFLNPSDVTYMNKLIRLWSGEKITATTFGEALSILENLPNVRIGSPFENLKLVRVANPTPKYNIFESSFN